MRQNLDLSRRRFLGWCAVGAGIPLLPQWLSAVDPVKRVGEPLLKRSLAAYSFKDQFKDGKQMDMFRFIDYCADHSLAGTELTSYFFPKDADHEYFLKLKRHAFLRGVSISGTAIGNNFALPKGAELDTQIAETKKWIDRAYVMGAPHIRIFAGAPKGIDAKTGVKNCIESIEECCEYAGKHGIFLGLENHGGIVAEAAGMLEILQAVQSPWLGVNLDTGNFHTDDPYGDLAKVAPWAVNVQVKVEISKRGEEKQKADMERLIEILRDVTYQGFVVLEYESKEDPFKAVPDYLKELEAAIKS